MPDYQNETSRRIAQIADSLERLHQRRVTDLLDARQIRDLDPSISVNMEQEDKERLSLVVDNHPQAAWDYAVSLLANPPFRWQVVHNLNRPEADEMEYLLYGFDAQMDEMRIATGNQPWRFDLAQQIVGGSYSWMTELLRDENGGWRAWCDFWDPVQVFWQPGRAGMVYVARKYRTTLQEAREHVLANGGEEVVTPPGWDARGRWRTGLSLEDEVECVDFWAMEDIRTETGQAVKVPHNAFLIEGVEHLPFTPQKDYRRIPIQCGVSNAFTNEITRQKTSVVTRNFAGRSVIASNIQEYKNGNAMRTYARERARMVALPDIYEKAPMSKGQVTREAMLKGGQKKITHDSADVGTDVRYIQPPSAPFDLQVEEAKYQSNIEQGFMPRSMMTGQNAPQFASGLLQSNLDFIAKMRLGRYDITFRNAAKRGMEQLVGLFIARQARITLTGENLNQAPMQRFFRKSFDAAQAPESWSIEVSHEIARPIDKRSILEVELLAWEKGLQSKESAQANYGVHDPAGEEGQRDREEVKEHPFAKAKRLIDTARKEKEEAQAAAESMAARTGASQEVKDAYRVAAQRAEILFNIIEKAMLGEAIQQGVPSIQQQPGREAPQPNEKTRKPPPSVESPQARSEGPQQREMMRNSPISRNGA